MVSTGETRIFFPFSFPIHSLSLSPFLSLQTDRSESVGLVFSRRGRGRKPSRVAERDSFLSLLLMLNVSKKIRGKERRRGTKGNERNIYKGGEGNRYGWLEIRTGGAATVPEGGSRRDKNTRSGWVGNCASVVTALGANERSDRAGKKTVLFVVGHDRLTSQCPPV